MANHVPEADWRAFRALREIALERLCRRVLEEIVSLCKDGSCTYHERYLIVYRQLKDRDDEIGRAFNDPRRSTMLSQLATMAALGLVEPAELTPFTPGTREVVELLSGKAKT